MKYRKTALVEAEQFLPADGKIPAGVIADGLSDPRKSPSQWVLDTLEGRHTLRPGDYICTGPAGERWNVEQSIFEATYEPAASSAPVAETAGEAVDWPKTCDGIEQPAFESWAKIEGFDMHEHPLHYLFMDPKTDAARQGWKAGLNHAVERMKDAHLSPTPAAASQPLGGVLTSRDFEALITDARTPKWVNGDYTPTEAMVEAGLEHCRPGNHANMVESFMEMMKQAEIDGLITYAPPVPAQDDDKLRIAVEALEEIKHLIKISPDVPSDDFDRGARAARLQAFDIASAALSALKSTAAQDGGE